MWSNPRRYFQTKEKILIGKTLVLRFGPKLKLSFQIVLLRIKLHQTVSVGKEHILFSFYLTKMDFPLICLFSVVLKPQSLQLLKLNLLGRKKLVTKASTILSSSIWQITFRLKHNLLFLWSLRYKIA